MKTKLLAALLCCLTAMTLNVLADDGQGDQGDEGGDQGGNCGDNQCTNCIQGSESLDALITLVATSNAPAGATGTAHLEAEVDDGSTNATLKVKVKGLDAGDYTLSAVKISDGSTEQLAQFSVVASQEGGDDDGEGDGEFGDDCQGGSTNAPPTNVVLRAEVELDLPPDLAATDIGQLVVADTNGTAMLVGDLSNLVSSSTITFKATVRVIAGSAAPGARGQAQFTRTVRRRHQIDRFTLSASGVPANTTLFVHVNGKSFMHVKSSSHGNVSVKKLPAKLQTVRSVGLMNSHGETAARVDF